MNTLEEVNLIKKNILLVDDELNVQEIVELCLQDLANWNVTTANSALQGLIAAEIHPLDAIVLDISIDNSLMFLQQLRENPKTQIIPIVLLSAKARWIDPQILKKYQIAGIILKPFDPVTLPLRIAQLLGWVI